MTESKPYSLPWHGNLYQGERASEKRQPVQGNLPLGPRSHVCSPNP
jgi:hypothetical protein